MIENNRISGIPYCRKEDYEALRGALVDPDNLALTWNDFEADMQEVEKSRRAEGFLTQRVNLDPQAFICWCKAKKRMPNNVAMFVFANGLASTLGRDVGDGPAG